MDDDELRAAAVEELRRHPDSALTTSELRARLRDNPDLTRVEATLRSLCEDRRIVLVERPPPDQHLPALAVAALVEPAGGLAGALQRAEDCCAAWERRLLATHRCH